MPCSGCGGAARRRTVTDVKATTAPARRAVSPGPGSEAVDIPDESFVLIELTDGNRGDHPVVGMVSRHQYGHHQHGDRFLMYRDDVFTVNKRTGQVSLVSHKFQPVEERKVEPPATERVDLPPPEPMTEDVPSPSPAGAWDAWDDIEEVTDAFDLQTLPGVGRSRAETLIEAGLTTPQAIQAAGVAGLKKAGLTNAVAAAVIEWLNK